MKRGVIGWSVDWGLTKTVRKAKTAEKGKTARKKPADDLAEQFGICFCPARKSKIVSNRCRDVFTKSRCNKSTCTIRVSRDHVVDVKINVPCQFITK